MQKRLWPLLAAAVVIIALLLYPSTQCHVTGADLTIPPPKVFVVPVEQGYAIGFSFNVTNRASCGINAQKIRVVLSGLVYADGRQVAQSSDETETVGGTVASGQSGSFTYTFDSYFPFEPAKLVLKVEMTFAEIGPVVVFDGDLPVPG
jgi:hypothetical protein